MKRVLQVLNLVTLLFAIAVNYTINGESSGNASITQIAARYDHLLNPASYAFGIWGFIYLTLLIFAVYQLWDLIKKDLNFDFVLKIGWWFIISNLANAGWIIAFTNNQIGWSVCMMLILFLALLKIVLNINMERWDAPVPVIAFIWWPVSLYFGWITIALTANISTYLTFLGWGGAIFSPAVWAIIVLIILSVIFITMIWKRNMREYASAGVWGIIAIAVKNWNDQPAVAWLAAAAALIILVNVFVHGYKNRATAPFSRRIKNNLNQAI